MEDVAEVGICGVNVGKAIFFGGVSCLTLMIFGEYAVMKIQSVGQQQIIDSPPKPQQNTATSVISP